MKILIFIEHSIMVRHFIESGVFSDICSKHNVLFIFPESTNKRIKGVDIDALNLQAPYKNLEVFQKRLSTWRMWFHVKTMRFSLDKQRKMLRKHQFNIHGWKYIALCTCLGLPIIYPFFCAYIKRKLDKMPFSKLEELLNEESPDLIIHPSVLEGAYINDLTLLSNKKNIPFVVIMNSWDNPSSKHAMLGTPSHLLVWGEQTKQHAIKYANVPQHNIIKFGSAQFDVYRLPPRKTKEMFCQEYNIDNNSIILLYAGCSKGVDEIYHLNMLDHAIESGVLQKNIVVIYRPHPWGGCGKDGHRVLDQNWKHVYLEKSMLEYIHNVKNKKDDSVYRSDYLDTHDILSVIDCIVSPLSTIILEAVLHKKPALCFLPQVSSGKYFKHCQQMVHFDDMYKMPGVVVANGESEFIVSVQQLINLVKNEEIKCEMVDKCTYFVERFDSAYSRRLLHLVEEIVS